jgi:UDP:flavonoid glycosyltransferase YjiC (YdhE family)
MLGLAIELRNRGHEVTFATNAHYAKVVTDNQLPFESLGSEEDFLSCVSSPDLWNPRKAFPYLFSCLKPTLSKQFAIHAQLAQSGPIYSITNCLGFGALMAQDVLNIPVITLHLQPAVLWSDIDPPSLIGTPGPRWMRRILLRIGERFGIDRVVCPYMNNWRREHGLPPIRKTMRWWNSPFGVICMFPEWYAPPQSDWPANLKQTDFPLWNNQSNRQLDTEVEIFLNSGDAPIVFTPGSGNIHGRSFFESAVKACIALERRAVLLTEFPDQVPKPLPSGIVHFPYVPLDRLLPRSAAFVHHGGIGSTSQAVLAGIPQVLTPLAHDQFDNANRVKKFSIGDSIAISQLNERTLKATLTRILQSSTAESKCSEFSAKLQTRDGLQRSAIAIEQLIAKH